MNELEQELRRVEQKLEDLVRQHVALQLRFICLEHRVNAVDERIAGLLRGLGLDEAAQ